MTKSNETPQLGTCECHKHTNQVCDICQKVSKPLPAEPVSAAQHKCVYDSAVAPMQYGEHLPLDVERYNSLFCVCGRVNHYGTWIAPPSALKLEREGEPLD